MALIRAKAFFIHSLVCGGLGSGDVCLTNIALVVSIYVNVSSLITYTVRGNVTAYGLMPMICSIALPRLRKLVTKSALVSTVNAYSLAATLHVIVRSHLARSYMRGRAYVVTSRILPVRVCVVRILGLISGFITKLIAAYITKSVLKRYINVSRLRSNACILALTFSSIPVVCSIACPLAAVISMYAFIVSTGNKNEEKKSGTHN